MIVGGGSGGRGDIGWGNVVFIIILESIKYNIDIIEPKKLVKKTPNIKYKKIKTHHESYTLNDPKYS